MNGNDPFAYCPALRELLSEKQFIGRSGKIVENVAISTVNNLVTLRNLHAALRPKTTLEVGLCYGGSCLVFTASHKEFGDVPSRQHTAIDPFQREYWDDVGLLANEKAGLSGFLDFIEARSCIALPELFKKQRKYDLVYIDGSHLYEDVFLDLYFVVRLLNPGGVVALDDSADPNISKVLAFAQKNLGEIIEPFDLSAYRADKGTTLKYKVAKFMKRIQLTAFRRTQATAERAWNAPFSDF